MLAGCDTVLGPRTYDGAMKAAGLALDAGDMATAFKLCQRALELADKVGNGLRTVWALECVAEASLRMGQPENAFPAYATVIGTYDDSLKTTIGRLRLRNNYGVALYNAGKKTEGITAIAAALDAYAGTPYSSSFCVDFSRRMRVVTNLAHATMTHAGSPIAERLVGEVADEIVAPMARTPVGQLDPGASEALSAIADLARARAQAARADELATIASERQATEEAAMAGVGRARRECDTMPVVGIPFETCLQKIK